MKAFVHAGQCIFPVRTEEQITKIKGLDDNCLKSLDDSHGKVPFSLSLFLFVFIVTEIPEDLNTVNQPLVVQSSRSHNGPTSSWGVYTSVNFVPQKTPCPKPNKDCRSVCIHPLFLYLLLFPTSTSILQKQPSTVNLPACTHRIWDEIFSFRNNPEIWWTRKSWWTVSRQHTIACAHLCHALHIANNLFSPCERKKNTYE